MAKIEFNSVFQEKNKFDFVMSVNEINLDRCISSKKTTPITPEAAAVGIVQLPIELLKSLEGKGEIKIGKILIEQPYPFCLVKVIDPNIEEFENKELLANNKKCRILKSV